MSAGRSREKQVQLSDLIIDTRGSEAVLLLRTITGPYVYSNTVTVAEDENGDVARLTVCNLEDNMIDAIVAEGSIVAVKQPCWNELVDGGYHIRVDHPSDLVLLEPGDALVPSKWRKKEKVDQSRDATQWKKEGDMMFLKKRFRKALVFYDYGLAKLLKSPDQVCEIDLHRKRCGVNIVLMRLDDATKDLANAISVHAASTPSLSSTELSNSSIIEVWLRNNSTEDPLQISSNIPRALKELAARIKFDLGISQPTPDYNFPLISSYVGPLTLHVDAANYIYETEIKRTASHGRGVFAKRALKVGELICAEKAFALPGYFMQDRSSDCLLYSLGDETAAPRPGAWLFKELVQKLRWNPSIRKDFFELDDGGYWKENGWDIAEGEDIPVDVFRIEHIRRLNCFSVPTRSADLLSQAPNFNPELRNGFWVHASYINHSCLPNSVRTFIGDIRFTRATRDIEAGEEITNQYISPDIDIDERQEKYRSAWGFDCDCELCVVDGGIPKDVRKERKRLFEELKAMVMRLSEKGTTITSIKKIARALRELEELYTSSKEGQSDAYATLPRLALVHPTLYLTEAWRSVKNVDKTIDYAFKLLRNFGIFAKVEGSRFEIVSNSGMVNIETVRALKYLSEAYTSKGEEQLATQCIDLAQTWFTVITGSEVGAEEFFREK
ncbi:SET domain-containing protein [Lentithecium fluviatile CBS 122367]|uniref:SET domain-containing protein n=1 Tax=Lentithecium fluviatile CBS 122367 TaxID=1168545 RepID=A0A6G1J3V7_9PLEO|nr:SET domain-containing protein [Lentithecium fluviatile CBS 122367]